jgi:hypothetical protein
MQARKTEKRTKHALTYEDRREEKEAMTMKKVEDLDKDIRELQFEIYKTVSRRSLLRICKNHPYADVPIAQRRRGCSGLALPLAHRWR